MKIIIIYTKAQTQEVMCIARDYYTTNKPVHHTHPCLQSSPVKSYQPPRPLMIRISSLPLLAGVPKMMNIIWPKQPKRDEWNPAHEDASQAMCALEIFKSPSAGWVQKWILNSSLMKPCARLNSVVWQEENQEFTMITQPFPGRGNELQSRNGKTPQRAMSTLWHQSSSSSSFFTSHG